MKILKLHHVQIMIPRGEESRARKFYCGLLGLVEIPKPGELKASGGFWLALDSFQIHIGGTDEERSADSREHIALLVDDLDEWAKHLAANSVRSKPGKPVSGLRRFDIRDPFNNRIEFVETT